MDLTGLLLLAKLLGAERRTEDKGGADKMEVNEGAEAAIDDMILGRLAISSLAALAALGWNSDPARYRSMSEIRLSSVLAAASEAGGRVGIRSWNSMTPSRISDSMSSLSSPLAIGANTPELELKFQFQFTKKSITSSH